VQLRHSWYGGITALVLLPPSLTVQAAPVRESLEATQNGLQRPQLIPPAQASPDGAPGQVVPPAATPAPLSRDTGSQDTGDGQSGDHLPIFEAARSDWFDEGDIHRDHMPLRRHGAEWVGPVPQQARWGGGGEPEPPPADAAEALEHPPPTSPAPPAAAGQVSAEQPSTLASGPLQAPSAPVTAAGLPRRVPRANLAPGILAMQAEQAEQEPPPAAPDPPTAPDVPTAARARSPEQVRSMLSSYRSGVERGRTQAGPESAADAPRSSRSDDDPAQ
jgi:hypothetical protein